MNPRRPEHELDKARAVQAHQLRRLVSRERELHRLRVRLDALALWSAATIDVASAVMVGDTRSDALRELLTVLVSDLGFDHAGATWDGNYVEIPEAQDPADRAFLASVLMGREDGEAQAPPGGNIAHAWGLTIHSLQDPDDSIRLVASYRHDTLAYLAESDLPTRELHQLTGVMVYPFDALRLRLALQQERDGLESRVRSATKDLREALSRAEDAREEAVRSASVRTQFLANMSHEIRTPMAAILGYTDLLKATTKDLPDTQRGFIDIISESGKHLLHLLDDILDLSRIESGRVEVELSEASALRVIQDVVTLLQVRADEKGVELRFIAETKLPMRCQLDVSRLRQIILNVAGNAIKFTESGHVEIRAAARETEAVSAPGLPTPSTTELTLSVSDTGVGIAEGDLVQIFDPFEMGRKSSKGEGGTGLGLAISRRLAGLMGGTLEAVSTLGEGSTFTLRLPILVDAKSEWETDRDVSTKETGQQGEEATRLIRAHALVVEDNENLQAIVCAWLKGLGLRVSTANDGREALDLFGNEQSPYDIVFMDMQMPRVDGYEATRRLRAQKVDVPIVALTAHAMAGERERCTAAGCTDYLTKPVNRDSLQQVLERTLAHA